MRNSCRKVSNPFALQGLQYEEKGKNICDLSLCSSIHGEEINEKNSFHMYFLGLWLDFFFLIVSEMIILFGVLQ